MDRISYKPLGMGQSNEVDIDFDEPFSRVVNKNNNDSKETGVHDNNNYDYDNNNICDDDYDEYGMKYNYNLFNHKASNYAAHFTLRQLRFILSIVAIILFLIFIAQLSTNNRELLATTKTNEIIGLNNNKTGKGKSSSDDNSLEDLKSIIFKQSSKIHSLTPMGDNRPKYANYLSSVLNDRNSNEINLLSNKEDLIDDLHYPPSSFSQLGINSNKLLQEHSTIWWLLNIRNDKYITVTNYIRAMKSFNYNSSITLTTQATIEFMFHTLELCKRWDGPISVAVFSPGSELLVSTTLIKFMRQCLPEPLSACIKDKVTWHLVYNKRHGPPGSAISYPKYHLDSINFPSFVNQDQCPKLAGPDASDLIKQFEIELRKVNGILNKSYRELFNLPYPINVLRNTARLASSTKYVLASDIELYPSINIVPYFTKFINNHDIFNEYKYVKRFDFTLPIFEVKSNITPPKTKQELIKLFKKQDAIFFHKYVCDACQDFPDRLKWLFGENYDKNIDSKISSYDNDDYDSNSNNNNEDEIKIFRVTQRNKTRESWEPIFIGTNDDPLYDDRLTWDGRRDKMAQMYEMCLLDYYHFVIHNSFLVHAPGIKHIHQDDITKRLKFIRENNAIYDDTIKKLKQQYSDSSNINKC